jgi:hypothetical protein
MEEDGAVAKRTLESSADTSFTAISTIFLAAGRESIK